MELILFVKGYLILLYSFFLTNSLSQYNEPNICNNKCVCLKNEGVIACHETDRIKAVPTNIDKSIIRLIIQKGKFDSPTIYSHNLTGLEHLTFLKIIYYNLQVIAPRAFYRMKNLQYLDLSHNKLLKVSDYAFSGLTLSELHLMENINVQLEPLSFSSMQSITINLRSNNMTILDYDLFKNTKVKSLYLYNNSLTRIDPRFRQLFNFIDTLLDVSNNPLICDCSLSWLAGSLATRISKEQSFITAKKINIVCNKPDNLHNKELMYLQSDQLKCFNLKIDEIKINISMNSYQIACVSKVGGYKIPNLIWQQYIDQYQHNIITGTISNERFSEDEYKTITYSTNTITISSNYFHNGFVKLVCIASLDDSFIQRLEVNINQFPVNVINSKSNKTINIIKSPKIINYWFKKNFTLLEMISAVLGTFCATFVSLVVTLRYLKTYQSKINKDKENDRSKHSNTIKPYWYASNGHSSTYSMPNSNLEYELPVSILPRAEIKSLYSQPNNNNNNNRLEFIDYKTHNPIVK